MATMDGKDFRERSWVLLESVLPRLSSRNQWIIQSCLGGGELWLGLRELPLQELTAEERAERRALLDHVGD